MLFVEEIFGCPWRTNASCGHVTCLVTDLVTRYLQRQVVGLDDLGRSRQDQPIPTMNQTELRRTMEDQRAQNVKARESTRTCENQREPMGTLR